MFFDPDMMVAMSSLPVIQLSGTDKLDTLRRLDQFRKWSSLDDKRYCLSCGSLINGWEIQVIGGTRGTGPLRIICPTERCNSIPMDWALPTDEVLSQMRQRNKTLTPVAEGAVAAATRNRGRSPLRWFAQQFRR